MTRPGGGHVEELNPLKQKQAQITIKHTQAPPQDKNKQHKHKPHTKEELKQARVGASRGAGFSPGRGVEELKMARVGASRGAGFRPGRGWSNSNRPG